MYNDIQTIIYTMKINSKSEVILLTGYNLTLTEFCTI